MSHQLITWSN